MKDAALIIFQKKPESGKVKTRLATTIGDAKALATYQLLLKHTHEQVALLDAAVFVYFDKEIDPNYLLHPRYKGAIQATGDLGQRMKTAIVEVRTSGYQRVLVIGSDCPGLQVSILQEAFSQLLNHDLVLGPAKDGGYYLIGMKKTHQELFADIPWSSADVLSKTLAIAKSLHLHVFLLPTLTDVDVYEDLDEDLKRKLDLA
ncbi:MAG TPA: TIGR04282 family arsenosugar biosynthesis glycosyltransferase [Cyclobacteriaceae bacterium]|nr:TIGR04282 family arsenosugar biosynthesis glycosyltransferase [Cyclobacteriaceae bacterium]